MPERVFGSQPDIALELVFSKPYRLWDRLRAHPGTSALALWSIIAGVVMLIDSRLPGETVSWVLQVLPDLYRMWLSIVLIMGGQLAAFGLLHDWRRLDYSWRVEQAGWWLLIGAWVAMAILGAMFSLVSVISWGSFLCFAVTGFVRGQAVRAIEKKTRKAIREKGSLENESH